jgi:hypothetical protein
MKTAWVNVAVFEDFQAAKNLQGYLKEHRIDSRTYHDKVLQWILFLCPPRAAYRVQVRDKIVKMTNELLALAPPPAVLNKAIHCPECGSLSVNYPQMTRKFLLPTLFLHLAIIFRVIKHQAYCEHCHFMWSLPEPADSKVQELAQH